MKIFISFALIVMLISLTACSKKQKKKQRGTIDSDTTIIQDTLVFIDAAGVLVGTYIPNHEYKTEHRITIDANNGVITKTRHSVIIHE